MGVGQLSCFFFGSLIMISQIQESFRLPQLLGRQGMIYDTLFFPKFLAVNNASLRTNAQVPGMASAEIKLGTGRIFPCCPSQRTLAGSMHDLLTSKPKPSLAFPPRDSLVSLTQMTVTADLAEPHRVPYRRCVQLRTNKVIKITDRFFGTPESIGIGR